MASERDREIWDDATNAVCQAMQEQKMCNCPDGDCLAAKIDFSPEKIATATRPAPAATDTGLETAVADLEEIQQAVFGSIGSEPDVYAEYDRLCELSRKMREAIRSCSQAVELLAAERAKYRDAMEKLVESQRETLVWQQRAINLKSDNAAKDKQLKEANHV